MLRYFIFTCNLMLRYLILTGNLMLRYLIFTCHLMLRYFIFTCNLMLRYFIFTCNLMLCYPTFTCHLMLRYLIFTYNLMLHYLILSEQFHFQSLPNVIPCTPMCPTLQGLGWLTVACKNWKPSWVLTRSEDVAVCTHMLRRMSTCGFGDKALDVKPKIFLQQLEKLLWPTKLKKKTGQISCVKSSNTENRHLAAAKHDFSAFLLVNRPAIANMIMVMCNAL